MSTRRITTRLAVAVLALIGQLTPVVAVPVAVVLGPDNPGRFGGCALESCACTVVEKTTRGCCCSKPDAAGEPKSCCEKPAKPKAKSCCAAEPPAAPRATPSEPTAKVSPGGSCSCDRPKTVATAEPATQAAPELPAWQFESAITELVPTHVGIPSGLAHPPQPPPPRV